MNNPRDIIVRKSYEQVITALSPLKVGEASKVVEAAGQYVANLTMPAVQEPKTEETDKPKKDATTKQQKKG